MSEVVNKMVQLYTEMTPNPATMKFVSNVNMLPGKSVDFRTLAEVKHCPLATALFDFPFVDGVFISNNFITVSKKNETEWEEVIFNLKEWIKNYLKEGKDIFSADFNADDFNKPSDIDYTEEEQKIVDVLEKYVRPAVEMDGGNISFKSYDEGIVTLVLEGACSGCPSSTVTLKQGIEGLLKRMVPSVKEVVAESQ